MRTTWFILGFMLLAGTLMFFLSRRSRTSGPYDSIELKDTSRLSIERTHVYLAQNAVEVDYNDSTGWSQDSMPLKTVLDGTRLNFFNKKYHSAAFFITYDNRFFFDFEIEKPDTSRSYDISFRYLPVHDSLYVQGEINTNQDSVLRFSGPMIRMYKAFAVIYNNKLPPDPDDSSGVPAGQRPSKTISILAN